MTTEETKGGAFPVMQLDRLREFGFVCPPETLLCFEGESIPSSLREDNPSRFALFHDRAHAQGKEVIAKVRHYEQDGFSFDADGYLIMETLDANARKRALRMEAERRAKLAAKHAYAEAMRAQGLSDGQFVDFEAKDAKAITPSDMASDDPALASAVEKIDLVGWAAGRAEYRFFAVKKAFRDQYGVDVPDKESAIGFLVEHGKISRNAIAG